MPVLKEPRGLAYIRDSNQPSWEEFLPCVEHLSVGPKCTASCSTAYTIKNAEHMYRIDYRKMNKLTNVEDGERHPKDSSSMEHS